MPDSRPELRRFEQDPGTFFQKQVPVLPEDIPKGKAPALKWSLHIDATLILPAVKEDALKLFARKTFPNGISAFNGNKIFHYEINHIHLQYAGDAENIVLVYPNRSGFAPAAVPCTTGTGLRVKPEFKTMLIYDAHDL